MIKRNKNHAACGDGGCPEKGAGILKKNAEKKASFLDRTLEEKVPARLQETLDKAFEKAFGLYF